MNLSRLAVFGLILSPAFLMAQKREDILSIQRDVAQLQDQVKQLQDSQNQRMTALEGLVKQALDQSTQLASSMSALQKSLGDQQTRIAAPVAVLGTKVDQMGDDLRSVRENVTDLATRLGNLDNKLADISSAIRTLNTPPAAPPPAPGISSPNGAITAPAPPPGTTASGLFQAAFRDYSSGNDIAMMEFLDYLKYFPQSEDAPTAQFYVGMLYDRAKQYDSAADAYDAVLERYPENPKTPDALYNKGVALMKGGRKTDAGTEFKDFLSRYPNHSLALRAKERLRELGLSGTPASNTKKKKSP